MAQPVLSKYIKPDVLTRLSQFKVLPRELVEGSLAGAHKSPFHGYAVEFASHREYVPGDDLRHLDWKVYFRQERHMIKQYEMETNFVCHLVLDISASMRYGEDDAQKLLYASRMATTLGYLVVEQSDKVSLTLFDNEIRASLTPSNNMGQIIRMTESIDDARAVNKTEIAPILREVASQIGRRSIVVIFSDFFVDLEDLEDSIRRLRYNNHEVVLFQVMHHDELHFDIDGMVRFIGLEDADQYLTRPRDIRDGYLEAMNRFNELLEQICDHNGCERILCDTDNNLGETFALYLQRRMATRQ
ncbi:MAG TPA: DUF58 domain-containing protein [Planctomycetaceae bacterium]|jgi:uncharacterized protein (DUF58 family)|nr:DUF58 domain-containing protein [Pirellulales bacterium]HCK72090.1 DUF58 domain-containing protein [Planctomycetaceae bacterium]HCP85329.1 DUF58 domain-containing protein [Planctomycetaceae bacterium]|tara:strand:+ start:1542 stop:2444 length:903 start_codon:yes stop_codon:yes gene_type:complete